MIVNESSFPILIHLKSNIFCESYEKYTHSQAGSFDTDALHPVQQRVSSHAAPILLFRFAGWFRSVSREILVAFLDAF